MKNLTIFLSLFILSCSLSAQQTINGTLTHDNLEREYILYVPANYTGDEAVPLVFNFHGYTSNANQQMSYGDFRSIADTAGFILVHPQGTLLNAATHFNVGGWTSGSTVDDIGFSEALIDAIAAEYNINLERVYSTGMSNGGFMSFLLACQLSHKIAAVASVTGSMTDQTFDECNPQHPTPVLQIHGTTDPVIPYPGNGLWSKSIDDVLSYWVNYNNCNTSPTTTDVPNTSLIDLSTAEHVVYADGDNGVTVEHFKISGGGHTWPGSTIPLPSTNYDMDASLEIWKFFSRYDINGLIETINTGEVFANAVKIYPNPTNDFIQIELVYKKDLEYVLCSPFGKRLQSGQISSNRQMISLDGFPAGIYYLNIEGRAFKILKTD